MLSKTAARRFFLLGTIASSLAFILLTIDTVKRVPGQTNQQSLTESAIRGKHLWDSKNCMGCHTLLGEGGYYAPELTKVFERRGEPFIKAILKDPQAMYPGQRRMVNYKLNDQEIDDLTAFLKWIGEIDLNGFPPKPDFAPASFQHSGTVTESDLSASMLNRPAVFNQICVACHTLKGSGGTVGPVLDDVGSRRSTEFLSAWLRDPKTIKADSKMPKIPLSEEQISDLVAFLSKMKTGVAR